MYELNVIVKCYHLFLIQISIFTAESHCIIPVCAAVRGVSFMRQLQQVEEENPTEQNLYSTESGKTMQSQFTVGLSKWLKN